MNIKTLVFLVVLALLGGCSDSGKNYSIPEENFATHVIIERETPSFNPTFIAIVQGYSYNEEAAEITVHCPCYEYGSINGAAIVIEDGDVKLKLLPGARYNIIFSEKGSFREYSIPVPE